MKKENGITLIALVITIIILLILAGITIATLTGKNGVLTKASTAKEKHIIEQYKEEINLKIAEEVAERKTDTKKELMIVSLDNKIRQKDWVNEIYKCNSSGEEQPTFEESTHLLVESKEHYEFLIEVNEAKETAKIVSSQKGTGEKLNVATITFNSNDGTNKTNSVNVTKGKDTKLPENSFTRKGYKFLEWNTNADGTGTKYENGANINTEQDITLYAIWKDPSTVLDAKEKDEPLSTTENTTITDDFGNQVIVPAGFKIGSESATNVTGGVIIEDVSHTDTAESEFVWIPVGKVYTDEAKTESKAKTINLSRYTFANDAVGTPTTQGTNPIAINWDRQPCNVGDSNYMASFEEKSESNLGNKVALNIEQFITKTNSNHGYYIGRYEARTAVKTERVEDNTDNGAKVTVKKDDYIYNWITQPESAKLSQNMYSNSNFTSDLVNSYAWDTAIVFLQTFDNRTDKTKPYSRQNSLNTGNLANKGTNYLGKANQDKICNIWDMASNACELTTETTNLSGSHCGCRAGDYLRENYHTALRGIVDNTKAYNNVTFRVILYL